MPINGFEDVERFLSSLSSRYPIYIWEPSGRYLELHEELDQFCALYLVATAEQRAEMRKLVAEPELRLKELLDHIGWARSRLLESKDAECLRRGLAAASLNDNRWDFRDTFVSLGSLYLTASHVGINCTPYFREAAEFSSTEKFSRYRATGSMRDFLAGFEKSRYFQDDVRPMIGKFLTPELRAEILNVLADVWDPLGVKSGKFPRKEYDSYVPDIHRLLAKGATTLEISEHLLRVVRQRMKILPPLSTVAAVRALRAIKLDKD
jgi:hypothetical protein